MRSAACHDPLPCGFNVPIPVLRYSPYSKAVTEVVRSGALGPLINVVHIEPIGYFHFAHSYVRGNWAREKDSCFSLMTKSCQYVSYVFNQPLRRCSPPHVQRHRHSVPLAVPRQPYPSVVLRVPAALPQIPEAPTSRRRQALPRLCIRTRLRVQRKEECVLAVRMPQPCL